MPNTPNLDLEEPAHSSANWDTPLNSNFSKIDAGVMLTNPPGGTTQTGPPLSSFDPIVQGVAYTPGQVALSAQSLTPGTGGVQGITQGDGTSGIQSVGGYFVALVSNANNVADNSFPLGIWANVYTNTAAGKTLDEAIGVQSGLGVNGLGTLTNAYMFFTDPGIAVGSTVHNLYQYYAQQNGSLGDTFNASFYSEAVPAGANNYAIYIAGGKNNLGPQQTSVGSFHITLSGVSIRANNAAALAAGLVAGDLYRTGGDPDILCIVH